MLVARPDHDRADYTHLEPSSFPFGMQLATAMTVLSLVCGWRYLFGTGHLMWLQIGYGLAAMSAIGAVATMFIRGLGSPEHHERYNEGWRFGPRPSAVS